MGNQLKMYWMTSNDVEVMNLPEGYSWSNYKCHDDIYDWSDCILSGPDSTPAEDKFKREIIDFTDIDPEKDLWFLDYNGKHIGTATSFVHKSTGHGDMHWVGIKEEFRGKGLAKYLSNKVMTTLKSRGVPYVSLTTSEGRPAALKSYLTAGFLPVEYGEGMIDRWEHVLFKYNIDSIQVLNEDATPLKVIYKKEHDTTLLYNKVYSWQAPAAVGPYSQAYVANGFLFASGMLPIIPETGAFPGDDISVQAEQSCINIGNVLKAAGSSFDKVVKTTCYLADMNDFAAFNEVYAKYFVSKPARSCVAVKQLPKNALCEIEITAVV